MISTTLPRLLCRPRCTVSHCKRIMNKHSLTFFNRGKEMSMSPAISMFLRRFSKATNPKQNLRTEYAKNAIKVVFNQKDASRKVTSDDCLNKKLARLEDAIAEARQCIEDCADLAETKDFIEETNVAKEAVRECAVAFNEILDDIETEEIENGFEYKSRRSNRMRRSYGLNLKQLKAHENMGSAASSEAKKTLQNHVRATVLEGKPLDASDIRNLDEAKSEITRLREMASKVCNENDLVCGKPAKRAAVMAKAVECDYIKKTIPKTDEVKQLIYNSIRSNILFRACSEEELIDLVDVFTYSEFQNECTVIQQGDEGERFYVVEAGTLGVTVRMKERSYEEEVGVPYVPGSAFGELALMYGSPRAATIRTKEFCKLWSIDRNNFKGITGQHKLKKIHRQLDFLRKVKIGDNILGDVLKSSDIDAMALATQQETFYMDDVIIRENEKGDAFYLIEKGTVDVFTKENGKKPVMTLQPGQFFGERALLSEDVRQATCIASSEVQCLFLMREDFVLMLGDLQDLLDGCIKEKKEFLMKKNISRAKAEIFELKDLKIMCTLGVGAFGKVKLVKPKIQNETCDGEVRTYALKTLSKNYIVENGLQEHVINEKNVMKELNHPFILSFHCSMQDKKHVYFLFEVLLGGEMFRLLRAEVKFPESWARFYSASVILAFCQIHDQNIAYRDLKPENLVLDAFGFLKIVDFGLAKKIMGGKTWTLCGTPDYLAPEVILNEGHDWAVDYWALGVLIYEMISGSPPFYAEDPMETYEKILSGHVPIPSHFSRGVSDIVKKLLKTHQSKRLGRTKGGTATIIKHKWFSGFEWDALLNKKIEVPILPKLENSEDTRNFDKFAECDEVVPNCDWTPSLD